MQMLGVDIGGSGIKGCLVDTATGELIGERHRLVTPQPATPAAVAHTLKALVEHFDWKGPVGCGFPATIHNGIAKSAANIDKSWIETDVAHLFADVTGQPCHVLNDADAAGLAEMRFGTGKDRSKGVIILVTVGTGIGTAVFVNGQLLPNTELGHLMLEGMVAEHYCSDAVRKREDLSWAAGASASTSTWLASSFCSPPTSSSWAAAAPPSSTSSSTRLRPEPRWWRPPTSTRPAS